MTEFATGVLGLWPVYPGHPCSIAFCIVRRYPRVLDAFETPRGGWERARSDGDIPGSGESIEDAMDLIRRVLEYGDTPEEAMAWGSDRWRSRTLRDVDYQEQYEEGVAEAERIAPMLLEELRRLKASV